MQERKAKTTKTLIERSVSAVSNWPLETKTVVCLSKLWGIWGDPSLASPVVPDGSMGIRRIRLCEFVARSLVLWHASMQRCFRTTNAICCVFVGCEELALLWCGLLAFNILCHYFRSVASTIEAWWALIVLTEVVELEYNWTVL